MSWLRLDDNMLEHPKWIRAIRKGGSASLHLWLALCAWSSKYLTDGEVPGDVLGSIRGPQGAKTLARAHRALAEASLTLQRSDGGITVVDFLEYNPSRIEVLAERERRAQTKRNQRRPRNVHPPTHALAAEDSPGSPQGSLDVPSRPVPSPVLEREGAPKIDGPGTLPAAWLNYPPGWHWTPETEAEAQRQGVSPAELGKHVKYFTTHRFGCPVTDLDGELQRCIPDIRKRADAERAKDCAQITRAGPSSGAAGGTYAWVPNAEHRAYAADKRRDLDEVLPIYRRESKPDFMSTIHADKDFMNRLRCWVATGEFIPKGELPLRLRKALPRGVESERSAVAS